MRTVNVGDVFILHDIIHGKFSTQQLKAMHYAFGTLSGRPVVVIRAPAKWDKFGMITVIPAMSKAEPAFEMTIENIFGAKSNGAYGSTYRWIPYYPYTVPVSRLGKYVGSLTIPELKELMESFEWIHNPFRQMNDPVPKMYQNLKPASLASQTIQNVSLNENYEMYLNGFTVPKVKTSTINSKFLRNLEHLVPEILSDDTAEESTVIPEETEVQEDQAEDENQVTNDASEQPAEEAEDKPEVESEPEPKELNIIINKPIINHDAESEDTTAKNDITRFSMNDTINNFINTTSGNVEILYELYRNGKFIFNESDVLNCVNKPNRERFDVTGLDVVEEKIKNAPAVKVDDMWSVFDTLSSVDIWVIVPNLGTHEISRVYHRTLQIALLLKEVCKATRKLTNSEYSNRRQSHLMRNDSPNQVMMDIKEMTIATNKAYETYADSEVIDNAINALKSYLTYNTITMIPKNLHDMFMKVPVYRIQQEYQGKHFLDRYKTMLNKIRTNS